MFGFFSQERHSFSWLENRKKLLQIINSTQISTFMRHAEDSNIFPTEINKFFSGSSLLERLCYMEICKHYLARKKVALGLPGGGGASCWCGCLCAMVCVQEESKNGSLMNSKQMNRHVPQGCEPESFTPKQVCCPLNCLEWNTFICLRI